MKSSLMLEFVKGTVIAFVLICAARYISISFYSGWFGGIAYLITMSLIDKPKNKKEKQ